MRSNPLQSDALESVAERLDTTAMSVTLAWLLGRSPDILLIPGTSSVEHLRENVAGAGQTISEDELDGIRVAGIGPWWHHGRYRAR